MPKNRLYISVHSPFDCDVMIDVSTGHYSCIKSEIIKRSIKSNIREEIIVGIKVQCRYDVHITASAHVNVDIVHWPDDLKSIHFLGYGYTITSLPKYLPAYYEVGSLADIISINNVHYSLISYVGDDYKYWDLKSVNLYNFLRSDYIKKEIIIENPWGLNFEQMRYALGLSSDIKRKDPLILHKLLRYYKYDAKIIAIFIEFILKSEM